MWQTLSQGRCRGVEQDTYVSWFLHIHGLAPACTYTCEHMLYTHIHRLHAGTEFLLKWWDLCAVRGMSLTSCVWTWTPVKTTQIEPVCSSCLKKEIVAVSRLWITLYVIKDFILQLRKVKKILVSAATRVVSDSPVCSIHNWELWEAC